MSETEPLPRSPELMSADDTALLVVDVQEKLIDSIDGNQRLVWNVRRLIDGAHALELPVSATEQYPRGLGNTIEPLKSLLHEVPEKLTFSCGGCPEIFEQWQTQDIHRIVVCGIETHVCVQQTVHDLMAAGFRVYVPVDAVGSRYPLDYQTALRRMDSAGATLTTTESALFEWCQVAGTQQFKKISALAKETPPANK